MNDTHTVSPSPQPCSPFSRPRLLLHACCAPCSSSVLERLCGDYDITVRYYNPNISPKEEYDLRADELLRLLSEFDAAREVKAEIPVWDETPFLNLSEGLEDLPEGGERCFRCYELRLRDAAEAAKAGGYDCFCTTLSVSPYKNAKKLNTIGEKLAEEYGVPYLTSDFKKQNGYLRSIQLSRQFSLYRQPYCGCRFSREARERLEKERAERAESDNTQNNTPQSVHTIL